MDWIDSHKIFSFLTNILSLISLCQADQGKRMIIDHLPILHDSSGLALHPENVESSQRIT